MKKSYIEDKPMFGNDEDNSNSSNTKSLSVKDLNEKAKIFNSIRLLDFSFKIVIVFLIVVVLLVTADILIQKYWDIENTLIKELFDLSKYAITTVLGYLFASKSSES